MSDLIGGPKTDFHATRTTCMEDLQAIEMHSVYLFGWRLHVPVNNFSVMSGRFPGFNQH